MQSQARKNICVRHTNGNWVLSGIGFPEMSLLHRAVWFNPAIHSLGASKEPHDLCDSLAPLHNRTTLPFSKALWEPKAHSYIWWTWELCFDDITAQFWNDEPHLLSCLRASWCHQVGRAKCSSWMNLAKGPFALTLILLQKAILMRYSKLHSALGGLFIKSPLHLL